MPDFHHRMLAPLIVGALPLTCHGLPEWVQLPFPGEQAVARQLVAQPGQFVELCTRLKQGRVLMWQFDAEGSVEFNTHFHVADEIRYPERMTAVSAAKGSLVPGGDQDYCWMWTNLTAAPLKIRVRLGP